MIHFQALRLPRGALCLALPLQLRALLVLDLLVNLGTAGRLVSVLQEAKSQYRASMGRTRLSR